MGRYLRGKLMLAYWIDSAFVIVRGMLGYNGFKKKAKAGSPPPQAERRRPRWTLELGSTKKLA